MIHMRFYHATARRGLAFAGDDEIITYDLMRNAIHGEAIRHSREA